MHEQDNRFAVFGFRRYVLLHSSITYWEVATGYSISSVAKGPISDNTSTSSHKEGHKVHTASGVRRNGMKQVPSYFSYLAGLIFTTPRGPGVANSTGRALFLLVVVLRRKSREGKLHSNNQEPEQEYAGQPAPTGVSASVASAPCRLERFDQAHTRAPFDRSGRGY